MWKKLSNRNDAGEREKFPLVNGEVYHVRMVAGVYNGTDITRYDKFLCRWDGGLGMFATTDGGRIYEWIDMDDVWVDEEVDGSMYKINLHAHTLFSDGHDSVEDMAKEAKRLGFCSLVVSDHYYNGDHGEVSMIPEKEKLYRHALNKAREILPVIRGMEVPFGGEEVLVFGKEAREEIIDKKGIKDKDHFKELKEKYECAFILCHPNIRYEGFAELLDGYERHNAGQDYFMSNSGEPRDLGPLENIPAWHNSDAHGKEMLNFCYNLVDRPITTEEELVKYIKSGAVPGEVVNER